LGDRKGIRPVKSWCWFVGGDDLTAALQKLVTTTSVIDSSSKIQNGEILVPV